jgi:hypothetical protein
MLALEDKEFQCDKIRHRGDGDSTERCELRDKPWE